MTDIKISELDAAPGINDNYQLVVVSDEATPDTYRITRASLLADLTGAIGVSFEATVKPTTAGSYSFKIPYTLTIPVNASTSVFYNATNPSGTVVLSIKDDGTEVVSLSVASNGTPTWTTTGGTMQTITVDSLVTFLFPAQDATWAGVVITLKGIRSIS